MMYLEDSKAVATKKRNWKRMLIVALAIVAVACVGVTGVLSWHYGELSSARSDYETIMKEKDEAYNNLLEDKQVIEVAESLETVDTELHKFMVAAKDLIIDEYVYAHTDEYTKDEAVLWWTAEDIERITYEGSMGIGINFDEIEYDIIQDFKKIRIKLPELQILTHEIKSGSFRADMVSDSMWVSSDSEEYERFKNKLKMNEESKVNDNPNVWETAKQHTEETFRAFFGLSQVLADYNIYFEWADEAKTPSQKKSGNIASEKTETSTGGQQVETVACARK